MARKTVGELEKEMVVLNAQLIIMAAKLAKQKGLTVATMGGGYCAVNHVAYRKAGSSIVTLKAAWLTGAQALEFLRKQPDAPK